jgi:hypothetical protein
VPLKGGPTETRLLRASSLQTSTEGIDPQIIAAFTNAVSDTPVVKSIVDREIDDRYKNATKLTQAQLERAIHEGQIRQDLLNVLPPKPGVAEGHPIAIADEHFRDTRNNIINSGQTFQFTRLQFRLLLDAGMPFRLPPMPTKPEHRGQRLNSLLMVPIGIVSDRMVHLLPQFLQGMRTDPWALHSHRNHCHHTLEHRHSQHSYHCHRQRHN